MCFRVLCVWGLYIDALSVSLRFSAIFCIYEHIYKYVLCFFFFLNKSKKMFWGGSGISNNKKTDNETSFINYIL